MLCLQRAFFCPVPGSSSRSRRQDGGTPARPRCASRAQGSPGGRAARLCGDTMQSSEGFSRISAVMCLTISIYCLPIATLMFALIISSCTRNATRTGSSKETCPSELLFATLQFAGVQLRDMSSKDEPSHTPHPDHKGQEFLSSTTRRGRRKKSLDGNNCLFCNKTKVQIRT